MKFQDSIKKAIKYLNSEEFKSREDAQDTIKSLPLILNINKLGFITNDSQEGIIDNFVKERAYVTGFIERDNARKLLKYISLYTDKIFYIVGTYSDNKWITNPQYAKEEGIPLTISNTDSSKNEPIIHTTMSVVMPLSIINNEKKKFKLNRSNFIACVCAYDPKWGRLASSKDGLWNDIIEGLKSKN